MNIKINITNISWWNKWTDLWSRLSSWCWLIPVGNLCEIVTMPGILWNYDDVDGELDIQQQQKQQPKKQPKEQKVMFCANLLMFPPLNSSWLTVGAKDSLSGSHPRFNTSNSGRLWSPVFVYFCHPTLVFLMTFFGMCGLHKFPKLLLRHIWKVDQ